MTERKNDRPVCLITGAAGGIGKEIVRKYLENGYQVVLIDLDGARLAETVAELGFPEEQSDCWALDITREKDVEDMVRAVTGKYGHIDVLVNTAGICGRYDITEDYGYDNFRRIYEVNVFGTFLMMEKVLPVMREQKKGVITNFGSCSGMRGYSLEIGYGSSKWAVIGMSKNVAVEYGKYNVRCNSISPGWVATEMMKKTLEDYEREGKVNFVLSPMDRAAEPYEIADTVFYLSSDQASFISGANICVDGGKTAC
ncbi:MAG: SDR family oxidoreductase [Erysipelotrichaceae bacterium]|nr:SDR family oxidoreductase [Erysipelotrichaceae bacterium]MBR5048835.1 SDR family oxidoreductase [Erysipelotrichaceae bacterium]